ncbi:hypothetical protein N0V88_007327 [Collariella sp. IMI 366227]|nr:hypothetical protein N0V88_007327 [Collariella sp. IMI 366227]
MASKLEKPPATLSVDHAPNSLSTCSHHCGSNLTFMYGTRDAPLYSKIELFFQTGVYGYWALVTVIFWILSPSFTPNNFKEIKGLLWVNQSLVLGAVYRQLLETDLRISIMFWLGLAVYGGLNLTYVVLDFLIAGQAMDYFEEVRAWLLGDRDFGLSLRQGMVKRLKMGAVRANQTFESVESRLRLPGSLYKQETYLGRRSLQVRTGILADVLAFALTVMLGILVSHLWFAQRGTAMRQRIVSAI